MMVTTGMTNSWLEIRLRLLVINSAMIQVALNILIRSSTCQVDGQVEGMVLLDTDIGEDMVGEEGISKTECLGF